MRLARKCTGNVLYHESRVNQYWLLIRSGERRPGHLSTRTLAPHPRLTGPMPLPKSSMPSIGPVVSD
jgi:hypothetical protein